MPFWVPLVAALLAGLLALSGVALGQHLTRQQKREERLEDRRMEQRDVLVDLIEAIEHWVPLAQSNSHRLLSLTTDQNVRGFFETKDAQDEASARFRLRSTLVRCRLVVTDVELRPLVLQLAEDVRLVDDLDTALLEATLTSKKDWPAAIERSHRHYLGIEASTARLQDAALRRLTSSPASSSWRQRLQERRT